MLVLSRKVGEQIIIDNSITLTVLAVCGNQVRIGITAPQHVRILRGELGRWPAAARRPATTECPASTAAEQ